MIVCLPILSSCSSKPPEPIVDIVYEKQYIPVELLEIGCVEQPAGVTVRSLAGSWANNTSCLRAYKKLVDGIINNYTEKGASQYEYSNEE